MRPTELQFRSPRERTPEFIHPTVTYDGRSLSKTPMKLRPGLPQAPRFPQYNTLAQQTGFCVGPGLYNLSYFDISRHKTPGVPVYRHLHVNKDPSRKDFYYAGNHLVWDNAQTLAYKQTQPKRSGSLGSRKGVTSIPPSSRVLTRVSTTSRIRTHNNNDLPQVKTSRSSKEKRTAHPTKLR